MIKATPEEILTWDTHKLWNTLLILEESIIQKSQIEKAKFGIKIKVPIWYITEEWYNIYPTTKCIKIKGHGKYEIKDFMNEKDNRDKIMKQLIIEAIEEEEITTPRIEQ